MFNKIKEMFGNGNAKTLQLGMDPQTYTNAPSPDLWELDHKSNKNHHLLVEDKICQNLTEVFQSNIFRTMIERIVFAKEKENTLPEGTRALGLKNTINTLHKKKDIFDGTHIHPNDLITLSQFLQSLSESDMKHIIDIYNKIAPKSGERKDQATMEAFIALTHPKTLKNNLEKEIYNKKDMVRIERGNLDSYKEVLKYLDYVILKNKSMQDVTNYKDRKKENLHMRTLKIGNHEIEVFKIINQEHDYGVYIMSDNNTNTLQRLGDNYTNSATIDTEEKFIRINLSNKFLQETIKVITLDGRHYEFAQLSDNNYENIKYTGTDRLGKKSYFDKDFKEI